MTQSEIRPTRSRLRRVVIVAIALALLILLVRTGVDLWAQSQISAEVALLERVHGSLDARTLHVAPVPEQENRARAMRAATALVTGAVEVQASLTSFLAQRETVAVPADLQTFVEANRAALRVAEEGRGRRFSNWEADYTTGQHAPGLMEIRALSNAIYVAGRMELDAGRPDDAARQFATGLALSASLRQEPSLVSQLIRSAVVLQHVEGVQRLVTQAEPSEAALQTLATGLTENRQPAPMHIGLLGELKMFHAALSRESSGVVTEAPLWPGRSRWISRPLIRLWHARYLAQLRTLLDVEMGPRPRPVWTEAPQRMSLLPPLGGAGLHRSMETGDHVISALGLAELAVALRRFRLTHGEYPESVSAVVPTYLATVPADPFTGQAPVYTRRDAGFTLQRGINVTVPRLTAGARDWTVSK